MAIAQARQIVSIFSKIRSVVLIMAKQFVIIRIVSDRFFKRGFGVSLIGSNFFHPFE